MAVAHPDIDDDSAERRRRTLWQMLHARLERQHEEVMARYNLTPEQATALIRPVVEDGSPMRAPTQLRVGGGFPALPAPASEVEPLALDLEEESVLRDRTLRRRIYEPPSGL